MFAGNASDFIRATLETTRYLGTRELCDAIVRCLAAAGPVLSPERWDTRERPRRPFDLFALDAVEVEWLKPVRWRFLCFSRSKPVPILITINIKRFKNAKFNTVDLYIRESYLKRDPSGHDVRTLMRALAIACRADYGYIAHERHRRERAVPGTPAERLESIFWTNYFGSPYVTLFGREKLMTTPGVDVTELAPNLIEVVAGGTLSQTLEFPERAKRVDDEVARYLDRGVFASVAMPGQPLTTPVFDFSEIDGSRAQ